jgi:chloramphenicol 3-O-phosphotransferase
MVVAALMVPCVVHAEAPAPPEAMARFVEGKELQKAGKMEEARAKYLQSLALFPSANILYNLAVLELAAERPAEALKYARLYLRHPKADAAGTAEMRGKYLGGLASKTGHASIVAAPGAQVLVDDVVVGKAPLDDVVDVMPGKHVFAAGAKRVEVIFYAGENKEISFESGAKAPPPAVTPAAAQPGPAGAVQYERSTAGYVVPAAVVGVGAFGLVLGGVFGAGSQAKTSEVETAIRGGACAQQTSVACKPVEERAGSAKSQQGLAIAMYVVGGVVVAAGIAAFVLWPKSEVQDKRSVRWSPWLSQETQGLLVEGKF